MVVMQRRLLHQVLLLYRHNCEFPLQWRPTDINNVSDVQGVTQSKPNPRYPR